MWMTLLRIDMKLSYHVIEIDYGTFKMYTSPMVDLVTC